MKKSSRFIALSLCLLVLLSACGDPAPATQPDATEYPATQAPTTEPPTEAAALGGSLRFTAAGSEVTLIYDGNGTVTAVTTLNSEAQNILEDTQSLVGQTCTEAVTELVTQLGEAGYLSENAADTVITISLDSQTETSLPSFAEEIRQQVQSVVTENQWHGAVNMTTEPPAQPTDAPTQPTDLPTEPPLPGNVPANAQLQADGTYLLTEPVDLNGNPVSGDTVPTYTHQRSYNASGDPILDRLRRYDTQTLYAETSWEYDDRGNCASSTYTQYLSTGAIQRKWEETYDASGLLLQKIEYGKDGILSKTLSRSYSDNGTLLLEQEYNASDILTQQKEYFDDGVLKTHTMWQDDGIMLHYSEHFSNGELKYKKTFGSTGLPTYEITVFEGEVGNIQIMYDNAGNMISRSVNGNPDGSLDTHESWGEDGTYSKWTYIDSNKGIFECEVQYPDGGKSWEHIDPVADQSHIIVQNVTNTEGTLTNSDSIWTISTSLPIEGYTESTNADGSYYYIQWVDGYIYKEISEGVTFEGYAYRATVYYYLTGSYPNRNAIKSSDLYFFADGGHVYTEFDEDGNETFVEDTTNCN